MAETDRRLDQPNRDTLDRPVVGLVAGRANTDSLAGAILRARLHGCDALVFADHACSEEGLEFARELDARVIEVDGPVVTDPKRHLMQAARRQGYPGLLLQDSLDEKVDYPRTLARLRDSEDYVVDAAPSPILETEPSVLVAIPAYNEARTVGAVVEQAMPYADGALVVDDGSTDETAAVAREAGATVLSHDRNRGYGASLKTAFREAERSNADTLVVLDADSQHDPADVPRLVERLHDGDAGIAVGSRFVADSETDLPVYRLIGIMVVNLLTNLSMGVVRRQSRIGDTQSGFRAYDRSVIESLAAAGTLGNGMGVSTDILHHVHTHNYDIEEVGVTVDYDVENGSKHDPISHGIHLVSNLLRTIERERPVTILGVPGFLSAFVGLGFGYWTFSQFIRSGTFPLGLAVAATFFVLFGVFAAFTAIILHSLNKTFD